MASKKVVEWTDVEVGDHVQIFDDGRVLVMSGSGAGFKHNYTPSEERSKMSTRKLSDEDIRELMRDLGLSGKTAEVLSEQAVRGGRETVSAVNALIRLRDDLRNTGQELSRPETGTVCGVCGQVVEWFESEQEREEHNKFKEVILRAYLNENAGG